MISIKKLLSENEVAGSLLRVIHLLLQGIGLHAVEGDPRDLARFREIIDQVARSIEEGQDAQGLLVQAGAAIKGFQEYSSRTTEYLRVRSAELQTMVKLLASTVSTISTAGEENVRRLGDIEKQVNLAVQVPDVRQVRIKLTECLEQIRGEAARQRTETGRTLEELHRELNHAQSQPLAAARAQSQPVAAAESGPRDPATGLPARSAAEGFLAAACQSERPGYVAVMAIDRIQTYNLRFGSHVGDEVLRHFSQLIEKRLAAGDRLFRWSGSGLVAYLPRVNRIEIVRAEMARALEEQIEYTVQTASRGILLPISARWAVFPLMAPPQILCQKIDSFLDFQAAKNQTGVTAITGMRAWLRTPGPDGGVEIGPGSPGPGWNAA